MKRTMKSVIDNGIEDGYIRIGVIVRKKLMSRDIVSHLASYGYECDIGYVKIGNNVEYLSLIITKMRESERMNLTPCMLPLDAFKTSRGNLVCYHYKNCYNYLLCKVANETIKLLNTNNEN